MAARGRGRARQVVAVVIPALNEEASIGLVLADIPQGLVDVVVVVDNGSTDRTAEVAAEAGALLVREDRRGYGFACLAGIAAAREAGATVLVFLDGDYSDYPEQLDQVVGPILDGQVDFVVGSRMRGRRSRGALLPQARFGNWLAGFLLKAGWGAEFTDLGPFRAVRLAALDRLRMQDETYGWTVEMQIKAVEAGLRYTEVPVDYRARIGESKITGTVRGTVLASYRILQLLAGYWMTRGSREYPAEA